MVPAFFAMLNNQAIIAHVVTTKAVEIMCDKVVIACLANPEHPTSV
jgi:hypothetical protein